MPIILSIPIFNQAQGVFVLSEMPLDFMVKGSPRAVIDVVMDEIFAQKFRPESSDPIAFTNARFAVSILHGVSDFVLALTKREHAFVMGVHYHYHQSLVSAFKQLPQTPHLHPSNDARRADVPLHEHPAPSAAAASGGAQGPAAPEAGSSGPAPSTPPPASSPP